MTGPAPELVGQMAARAVVLEYFTGMALVCASQVEAHQVWSVTSKKQI